MTREEIATILRNLRVSAGWTQKQVATHIGKKQQTVASWEVGQSQPDADTLFTLCELYGTTVNDAFGFRSQSYTPQEKDLLKKYRALDGHGRDIVDTVLEKETQRIERLAAERTPQEVPEESVEMIVYDDAAAAGSPLYAESGYERIAFPISRIPYGANFGVRIRGRSMEPTIADGTIVWVRKQETLEHNEIGVFHTDDGAVCKRYVETDGGVELHSDNPAYPNIMGSALHGLRCFGKVLFD